MDKFLDNGGKKSVTGVEEERGKDTASGNCPFETSHMLLQIVILKKETTFLLAYDVRCDISEYTVMKFTVCSLDHPVSITEK